MGLRIASWVQKSLVSGSPQFTRNAPVEVEPSPQFFGDVTIRAPHSNPAGSSSRSLMTVLFEDESGAVVDNAHPRAGDIPWSWTTSVGGGRWFSYITTGGANRTITVPQGLRLSLVGLWGWDDSSTARPVEAFTIEGNAMAEAQVARYARPDGSLATVGEARVWDGQWRTVYTSMDTVVITGDGGAYGARDQLRAALTDYGLDYRTVTELPFKLDTSQVTNMYYMFQGCSALTSVPDMDTSQVTEMPGMFDSCSSLTTAPAMDTSQVTNMASMFYNCRALTYVPDMETSNVTTVNRMFYGCSLLTDGNVRLIGRRGGVNIQLMISGSGLTRQPFYDTNGNPI